LSCIGNKVSNQIFEQLRDDTDEGITATSSRKLREEWIRKKYVEKRFVQRQCTNHESEKHDDAAVSDAADSDSMNHQLYQCSLENDIVGVCRCLAAGADINWKNPDAGGTTCLQVAVQGAAVELSEFLLLNGAKVDIQNDGGQTAIHLAIQKGIRG
jgi:hypothetical protein